MGTSVYGVCKTSWYFKIVRGQINFSPLPSQTLQTCKSNPTKTWHSVLGADLTPHSPEIRRLSPCAKKEKRKKKKEEKRILENFNHEI